MEIFSDESSVYLALQVMPSASHSENGPNLYEPIHGSSTQCAGQGIAQSISMILSVAMMLRDDLDVLRCRAYFEHAVETGFGSFEYFNERFRRTRLRPRK